MSERIVGLVAGWGRFPIVVAEGLAKQGLGTACLGVRHHADPALAGLCDHFRWIGLARLGAAVRFFRRCGVRKATMAGKIRKTELFRSWALVRHLPDWRTLRRFAAHFVLNRRDRKDDTLLGAVAAEFAAGGIVFEPATSLVPELLVKEGTLTRHGPTQAQWRDIEFGWTVAKELGRLDIGQSVAVKGGTALAVEAIEGTDECIRRAGRLCRSGAFSVVKVSKPQQDMRFDVPTVGVGTLSAMVEAGADCLAIEADRTILVDRQEVIEIADRHGIAIVALDRSAVA
jgi:hypothetical protein